VPGTKLAQALAGIDWAKNIQAFTSDAVCIEGIAKANLRLAVWAKQFESVEKSNPALCFIREMQLAGHHVAVLSGLALYKCAAGSMRTMVETALYFTYFRTHPSELATLVRDPDYYVTKSDLVEYHKEHTRDFVDLQKHFALLTRLQAWYGIVSAVIHGQVPGKWTQATSLSEIHYIGPTLRLVTDTFAEGSELVHNLFLCTVGRELWDHFSPTAKGTLIAGLAGPVKAKLGLDRA
jgi:hypothetical protein